MNKPATIKDIASYCGLSVATVSRVINDKGPIKADTAERVRQAVDALGYAPSMAARALKTASSSVIGVILPSLTNPVFAETASGIQQRAREKGLTPIILSSDYDLSLERSAVATLLGYQVEGVLLTVNDAASSDALARLDKEGVPYCLMHNVPRQQVCGYIGVDNYRAAAEVAVHLADLGHRCIGMVSGDFQRTDRARDRHAGFLAGLRYRNLELAQLVQVDPVNAVGLTGEIHRVYEQPGSAPTAWFCSNDLLALATIAKLQLLGIRVPEDVSIVGFDGIQAGTLRQPNLASIRTPNAEIGAAAVDQLLTNKRGIPGQTGRTLGHQLLMDGTVAPPPDHLS
ncbi:LacI family DNA-binding transcriptional regulator [Marinobacterium mangrovicola]|uniref:LacI family transcriptional regulator n=1 Tax=Marinobacterium mangrovicola TaxID=1476959 RepID=A0A4R1GFL2_9GAMM|nr:LacI family DNA-binding transcriptional regulator [Marinobacterium mangrovicola]TCK07197.1 LacI family transcriptional regulator [Marinobacterium mangrovicola]